MACCKGSEIDLKEMRTEGQKQMGDYLGPLLQSGISRGATPFSGQLSAPADMAQLAAMNTMMGIGGQGPYTPGFSPSPGGAPYGPGPVNQASIINASPGTPYPNTQPGPPDSSPTSTVTSTVNSTTLPGVDPTANPATVMATTYDNPVLPGPGVFALPSPNPRPDTTARAGGPVGRPGGKQGFFDPYQSR